MPRNQAAGKPGTISQRGFDRGLQGCSQCVEGRDGLIVLFIAEQLGTIVQNGSGAYRRYEFLGAYRPYWGMEYFKPFTGIVQLTNA